MGWEKISLRAVDSLTASVAAIQDAFIAAWSPVGAPPEAILYATRTPPNEAGTCEMYLNPMAAEIARLAMAPFHPVPVDPPNVGDLQVSVFNSTRGRRAP